MRSIRKSRALLALVMLSLAALACNVQFGGSVQAPAGTPGSSVTFIGPANNSVIAEGSNVVLAVLARDSGAGVAKVNFLVNGVAIGSREAPGGQPSFSAQLTWVARGVQGHLITAEALRADGSSVGEAGITIQVVPTPTSAAALATSTPTLTIPTLMPTPGGAATATPTLNLLTPGLTIVSGETPSPALAPSATTTQPPAPTLRVIYDYLNIRAGPSAEQYDIIGKMNKGDTAKVIGRNTEHTWLVIQWGQVVGWVSSSPDLIEIVGDMTYVPLATVPQEATPPTATPGAEQPGAAPIATASNTADLVIEKWVMMPPSPAANQSFYLTIVVRNQGSVDAPASVLRGVFQPGNVQTEMSVPPIKTGSSATLPPLYVTLPSSGASQTGTLTVDASNEVPEGAPGEANNVTTITYDVR